jgi:hypothetical protein
MTSRNILSDKPALLPELRGQPPQPKLILFCIACRAVNDQIKVVSHNYFIHLKYLIKFCFTDNT